MQTLPALLFTCRGVGRLRRHTHCVCTGPGWPFLLVTHNETFESQRVCGSAPYPRAAARGRGSDRGRGRPFLCLNNLSPRSLFRGYPLRYSVRYRSTTVVSRGNDSRSRLCSKTKYSKAVDSVCVRRTVPYHTPHTGATHEVTHHNNACRYSTVSQI